ncbi:Lrp/AsnC family transcriptional regulator [Nocardia fluminea]|uniref:Lrp/AsnC family transcriptional regulator n=1 Tax=Nocardia fluminea TaxID=134984 RepID=UPI003415512E
MQDSAVMLAEDDLTLIHALQLRPRGSWTELGNVLGVDPVTVARRWSRLVDRREAWVCASPGPMLVDQCCTAYVDIDCSAGEAGRVTRALAAHPHMLTLERSSHSNRILATVATADMGAMGRYTLDILPNMACVTQVHARIVTHRFAEGGDWRIDALAPAQKTRLAGSPRRAGERGARRISEFDRALLGLLSRNGRAASTELAQELATSASTVKRRIDELVRLGLLGFRCDFARPLGGWPIAVTFRAVVPASVLHEVGDALILLPQTRNCVAVTGGHNLMVQASLHNVGEVARFEDRLVSTHPALQIVDRTITLRHDKLLGRILDHSGRTEKVIAPDIWSDLDGDPEAPEAKAD